MKKLLLMLSTLLMVCNLYGQTTSIMGTITDGSNESLPGVNIIEKGTTNGTSSDSNGKYTLSVSKGATLVFSFLGYASVERVVGTSNVLDVSMNEEISELSEVVVVGYGTVKKSDLTGSVSTINAKEAFKAPAANLGNALQGRASGVQVTTTNGSPGSGPSIRIRGGNSITAGNEPLYVVDGFVGAGDLSTLNPNDIETMQILKDASSTAIYGARGANGVVLITTKKGKAGQPVISLKTSFGMQQLPSKVRVQTGREFAAWINSQDVNPADGVPFDLANLPGQETDWQDVLIRPAPISDHQLSVAGGTDKTQYFVSAGFLSQEGIVQSTSFKRYSLRSNIETKLSKVFSTGINLSLSRSYRDNNDVVFRDLIREDPLKPVYDAEGNYNLVNYGVSNTTNHQLANNELNLNDTFSNRALLNTYIQASLFDRITVRSTFGGDFLFSKQNQFTPSTNPTSLRTRRLGSARIDQFNDIELLNENTIDYKQTFGDHSLNALGGITFQKQNRETIIVNANQIPSDGVGVNAVELAPVEETSMNTNYSGYSLFSLLGRVNYSYRGKYLVTATIRRDGSSRLGEYNKYAVFPSVAVAWRVSDEPFFENIDAIDLLKVRASYGLTGNQGISPYSTLATFATTARTTVLNGVSVAGVTQGTLANPNLKWETTAQYDLGIEIDFFKRRLSAEIDFYYKKTEDLLLAAEVPNITGFTTTIQNVGSLENRGVDVSLNGVIINSKDFEWNASLNISTFRNKVLNLGNKTFIETTRLGAPANDVASQLMVGQPVGTFWGAVYKNVDPATGDAVFADLSGPDGVPDGVFDPVYDKTVIGTSNPDFYGGFQSNFIYKNFDLNTFFPFTVGNDIYNTEAFLAGETQINSFASLRENMWSVQNPNNASFPRVGSTSFNRSSSFFVQNGSFLRLGTLQLGYSLPKGLLKGIKQCRFYFTGTNLFLIKSKEYLGYDPDVSSYGDSDVQRGFDSMAYPQNRSFLVGLNITF